MFRPLRRAGRWLARTSRTLGNAGYLLAFAVPSLATLVPALLAGSGGWWAALGPAFGIFLTVLRNLRVREIRARLASLQKTGDSVANDLENGLADLQEAARQGHEPTTMWSQAFVRLVEWQGDVDLYLRDTPELGEEYVHRFDLHPEVMTRSLKGIDRTEAAIPQVREKQRRLATFREEVK